MTKGEVIMLRISTEDKAAIKAAADKAGKSITSFITDAAVKRASAVEARGVHGGVATSFRALAHEAASGGTNGYERCGHHLASVLASEQPGDVYADEWASEVVAFQKLVSRGADVSVIWGWFKLHYPKFLTLIPARRREQFVAGVRRADEEDRIRV
jgi:hypothetical protein